MPEEIKDLVPLKAPSESRKRPSSSPVFSQEETAESKDRSPKLPSSATPLKTPKQFLPNYIPFEKATVSSRPHTPATKVSTFSKSRTGSNHELQNNSTKYTKENSLILKTPKQTGNWNTIGIIRLHEEIAAFHDTMMPLPENQMAREDVVSRVAAAVKRLWPGAKVEVFGSFRTGLYLPTSDIDLVVFGCWKAKPLYTLKDELIRSGISDEEKLTVIAKASVPIVKFIDKPTGIKVDIAFNITNGLTSAKLIQEFLKEFPSLPFLVLVLKQFVHQRDLNEVFTGGIGSYSLILLAVSYLQLHTRAEGRMENVNYGVQLLEFFELYGLNFNYFRTGISVRDGGSYVKKDASERGRMSLYLQDPLCPENDVARGSYNISMIQTAFIHAYYSLCNKVLGDNADDYSSNRAILSCIINVENESETLFSASKDLPVRTPGFVTSQRPSRSETLSGETEHSIDKKIKKFSQNSEKKRKRDFVPDPDNKIKQKSPKNSRK